MIQYDCAIVGAGLAGLQAAIQLGRYQHRIVVVDSGGGRSNVCRCYHNILGWPDGISGKQLRQLGRQHAERLGVEFISAQVSLAEQEAEEGFVLTASEGSRIRARRLLLATGVQDRIPMQQQLAECLGLTVFVCPDCDGYEVRKKRVLVLGSGNPGAAMSLTLRYWTSDIIYINHERASIHANHTHQLEKAGIITIADTIQEVVHSAGRLQGVVLGQGSYVEGGYGFTAFGGNHVHSELADQLGVALTDNHHIEVDPRTKMTNVTNVWAAGDVTSHSEQAVIAIGDGSQAAIWIHKSLLPHANDS